MRGVVEGLASRPDLLARAAGADKSELDSIAEDAREAAGQNQKREYGTYLHGLMDRYDSGRMDRDEWLAYPEADRRDVAAYALACRSIGLVHVERECFMVNDARKLAGTPDGLAYLDPKVRTEWPELEKLRVRQNAERLLSDVDRASRLVTDLKTGSADYGAPSWHMQLATYAESTLYDIATDERRPTPAIDQEYGLVIHLPAGTAKVTFLLVDLRMGAHGLDLAERVRTARNWGKRKGALPAVASFELPEEKQA
jgi:hypothetical protein